MRHLCAFVLLLALAASAVAGPGFRVGAAHEEGGIRALEFASGDGRVLIVELERSTLTAEDLESLSLPADSTVVVATGGEGESEELPIAAIRSVVEDAHESLTPADLRYGQASLRGLVENRSGDAEPLSERLGVLQARDRHEDTVAVLLFLPAASPPKRFRAEVRAEIGEVFHVLWLPGEGDDQDFTGSAKDLAAKVREALDSARALDPEWGIELLPTPNGSRAEPEAWDPATVLITLGDLAIGAVPGRLTAAAGLWYRTEVFRDMGRTEPPEVLLVCRADGGGSVLSPPSWRSGRKAPPPVEIEPLAKPSRRNHFAVQRVWMDSPRPSGHATNDRFPVEHYVPEGETKGAMIVLPIWRGGVLLAERVVAVHLARRGYEVAIMPLPWQFQRAPRGVGSGRWTVSSDLPRTKAAMEQALADVRILTDWLHSRKEIGEGRVGVLGISLGAHVAAGAFQLDDRLRAAVVVMAGGDPASMVWAASKETRGIKRELMEKGVTLEKLREMLRPLDPASVADPWPYPGFPRYRGVLMINGTKDRVIPPANARILHEALGRPEIVWFDVNHYSMAEKIDEVLALTDRHLDRLFD